LSRVLGILAVKECINGVASFYYATPPFMADEIDLWYDVYVQLEDDTVAIYSGARGDGLVPVMTIQTAASIWTNGLRVRATGLTPFEFDDFRVMTRSEDQDQSAGFTYNDANQLTAMAVMGLTIDFAYDAWGRIASRSLEFEEETYTATYAYRYGDKLRYINSDWPGDTTYIAYNYDGLGKRRFRNANDQYTWWRWDLGWSAVTQYADTDTDWTVEGFNRFFVPYGHAALAEADVSTTPANAAYNYLAQDHLGSGRFVYNQAKAETASVEHLPYGDRYAATGDAPYHEFTGKPWDEDAGLYYFPYRYYAPTIGRWTTPDPLGLIDGPNFYGYAKNKPINTYDELGLACCPEDYQACVEKARSDLTSCLNRARGNYIGCQLIGGAACAVGCGLGCAWLAPISPLAYGVCIAKCMVACVGKVMLVCRLAYNRARARCDKENIDALASCATKYGCL
jgi:RHS repeat-associated protein